VSSQFLYIFDSAFLPFIYTFLRFLRLFSLSISLFVSFAFFLFYSSLLSSCSQLFSDIVRLYVLQEPPGRRRTTLSRAVQAVLPRWLARVGEGERVLTYGLANDAIEDEGRSSRRRTRAGQRDIQGMMSYYDLAKLEYEDEDCIDNVKQSSSACN
jgi:hypothetical protein